MPEFVFTAFIKEHRPLSAELWQRARPLMARINAAAILEELDAFDTATVAEQIRSLHIEPPRLGGTRGADDRVGEIRGGFTGSVQRGV